MHGLLSCEAYGIYVSSTIDRVSQFYILLKQAKGRDTVQISHGAYLSHFRKIILSTVIAHKIGIVMR